MNYKGSRFSNAFYRVIGILTTLYFLTAFFISARLAFGSDIQSVKLKSVRKLFKSAKCSCADSLFFQISLVILTVVLALFVVALFRWISCAEIRKVKIAVAIFAGIMVASQMALIFGLNIIRRYDEFEIQDQAMRIAGGLARTVDYEYSYYFLKYSNNDFYLLFATGVYKLASVFGIHETGKFFCIINALFIDAAILLFADAVRVLKGNRAAGMVCIYAALNPLNVLFLVWSYTLTLSILPMSLIVNLAARKTKKGMDQKKSEAILSCSLTGFAAGAGYLLRPTAVFPMIAVILYRLLRGGVSFLKKRRGRIEAAVFVLAAAGAIAVFQYAGRQYDPDKSLNLPVSQWLVLGNCGSGRWEADRSGDLVLFEDREGLSGKQYNQVKEAVRERGVGGNAAFYAKKVGLSWSDGTGAYINRYSCSENGSSFLYNHVAKNHRIPIVLYCYAYRLVLLLFAAFGAWKCAKDGANETGSGFLEKISLIICFGAMLFYTFWEGKESYSYPFLLFCEMLALMLPAAFAEHRSAKGKGKNRKGRKKTEAALLASALVLLLAVDAVKTEQTVTDPVYSILTTAFAPESWTRAGNRDISQEFYPKHTFNTIRIRIKEKKNDESRYRITISSDGEILRTFEKTAGEIRTKKNRMAMTLKFDPIEPYRNQKFILTITCLTPEKDSVKWSLPLLYVTSLYKGERTEDGVPEPEDLLIDVYYK